MMKIGKCSLLERVLRRAKRVGFPVILATTVNQEDNLLEATAQKLNIPCFRGSEENVLQRAVKAAEAYGLNAFARLCGDRPLFSIEEMKFALDAWSNASIDDKPDVITNNHPNKTVRGLTTEVINVRTLRKQLDAKPDAEQREHITTGFYKKPDQYRIESLKPRYDLWSTHSGFAVDSAEDFSIVSAHIQEHGELDYELKATCKPQLQS